MELEEIKFLQSSTGHESRRVELKALPYSAASRSLVQGQDEVGLSMIGVGKRGLRKGDGNGNDASCEKIRSQVDLYGVKKR